MSGSRVVDVRLRNMVREFFCVYVVVTRLGRCSAKRSGEGVSVTDWASLTDEFQHQSCTVSPTTAAAAVVRAPHPHYRKSEHSLRVRPENCNY